MMIASATPPAMPEYVPDDVAPGRPDEHAHHDRRQPGQQVDDEADHTERSLPRPYSTGRSRSPIPIGIADHGSHQQHEQRAQDRRRNAAALLTEREADAR